MKRFRHIIYVLFVTMLLSSCETVFQYPDENAVDPTLVNLTLNLTLDISSINDFEDYDGTKALTRSDEETQYHIRTIIEIYESGNSSDVVARSIKYYDYLDISEFAIDDTFALNAKEYRILVWADVVDNTENIDLHYISTDLRNILPTSPYTGATDLKHCFSDVIDVDLTPYRDEWNVVYEAEGSLERPLSRFEIITTDLDQFIAEQVRSRAEDDTKADDDTRADIDPTKYTIKLCYDGYMPYGYNVETDIPNRAETGVEVSSSLEQLSDTDARLTFDHVFVNHEESSVNVSMMVYDEDGELATQTSSINIPLLRNKRSIVTGEFLTEDYVPGVTMDPSFDGEYNIWID